MAITYTGQEPITGPVLRCKRCKRLHAYPVEGGAAVRCECGWWYQVVHGKLVDSFHPRLAGKGYA